MTDNDASQDLTRLTSALQRLTDDLVGEATTTSEVTVPDPFVRERSAVRAAGAILTASDRLMAAVIGLLGQTSHRGVIAEEGMTTSTWLRVFAARTVGDEKMLTASAERLADMPAVSARFADGTLSWPAVRGIVTATRNLTAEQRRWLDKALAADHERVCGLDADQVVAAADRLADQARPDLHSDREQRQFQSQRFSVHPRFDGSSHVSGEFDAEATATLLAGLDTRAARQSGDDPDADRSVADQDCSGDADWRGRRGRSNASRLIAIIAGHLAGGHDGRARPPMLVITDVATLRTDEATGDGRAAVRPDDWSSTAQLLWNTHRPPVELTASAAQRLACDATLRHILVDGVNVLGATAAHPGVSATLRAALIVRDGGCRFPGCHAPVAQCDNHHLIPISRGGRTTLANLALVCSNHHHAIHDSGWVNVLHDDGTITFTRRGVTITSRARVTQRITSAEPSPAGRPRRRRSPPTHTRSEIRPPTPRYAQQRPNHRPSDAPAAGDNRLGDPPTLPF